MSGDDTPAHKTKAHKPKMAVKPETPPGQEQDGKGHVIPFSQRTKDDQEKTLNDGKHR